MKKLILLLAGICMAFPAFHILDHLRDEMEGALLCRLYQELGNGRRISFRHRVWYGIGYRPVFSTNIAFSYNLPHWQIGMEYMPTTAWYGDTDKAFGKTVNTHSVTNHRILGLVMYYF